LAETPAAAPPGAAQSADPPSPHPRTPLGRLPFYYGWVVVAVAFVTMGIGVSTRTAFSLLYPPILAEFGWSHGATAGAFSVGFLGGAAIAPFLGAAMDRFGPRLVVPFGALLVSAGLLGSLVVTRPWQLYITLGLLVVGGSVVFSYIGHSMFLPNWFVKRRGLANGIAFSGVGVGAIVIFPWLQTLIVAAGWRQACLVLALLLLVLVLPLNFLFQRARPEAMGLLPDGEAPGEGAAGRQAAAHAAAVVDLAWVATDWTLRRALRTARFWWLAGAFFLGLYGWYAVQVHQTQYLLEHGISTELAALALGLVGLGGIAGQIGVGHFSDRFGREWAWTVASLGFALTYLLLLLLPTYPSAWLVYAMVAAQGLLGYGAASVFGAIPVELFQGRAYGRIFGVLSLVASLGAGTGPWVTGLILDWTGSYAPAFWLCLAIAPVGTLCVWMAAPRKVRRVAGRMARS
jgi:MFS family permease